MNFSRGLGRSLALVIGTAVLVVPAGTATAHVPDEPSARSVPLVADGTDTDGDGRPDDGDGCPSVAASTATGCPSASRKVSLKWTRSERRLLARVTSPVDACASRARIKLWLDRAGKADRLLSSDASSNGRRRFKVPGGARYYVTVSSSYSPGVAECGKASSRTVRVPR